MTELEQSNKLIIHVCGGCATSIADKVFKPLRDLGDSFCNMEFRYIDTTDNSISKIEQLGDFWRIKTSQHGKAEITGSGGY